MNGPAEEMLAKLRRSEDALRQAVERYEQQVRLFDGVASTTTCTCARSRRARLLFELLRSPAPS